MTMGEKIKYLREEKGMTLEELGNKVGVGKSTVRKWEVGMIANMRRDKIAKLAAALQCSPAYLMGWDESPAAKTPLRAEEFSDHEIDVIRHYRAADEPIKGAVRKLLDMPEEEKSASLDLSVS